jgi:hypothetical protein
MSRDAFLDPNYRAAEEQRQQQEREAAAEIRSLDTAVDYPEYILRQKEMREHGIAVAFRNAVERERLRQEFGV